jgi:hypothetical protein
VLSEPPPLLTSPHVQPAPSRGGGTHPSLLEIAANASAAAEVSGEGSAAAAEPAVEPLLLEDFPQPAAFPEEGFLTRLGGVLYLINLIEHLDLLDRFEKEGEGDLIGPWGLLEMLARLLLGPLTEEHEHDPLWSVLADLDGRAPAHRLEPALSPGLTAVFPDLRLRLEEALGVEPGEPGEIATSLLLCPGRIYVTSSHVDLVAELDAISLPARRAGLDRDPGWVPRFGRVVRFHFE